MRIRKVYIDFVRNQLASGRVGWLFGLGAQYAMTKLSHATGRPLCGPILGTLLTNYACNLRCSMCRMPQDDARLRREGLSPLSTDGMLSVIDAFARLGTRGIGFTGGEPMLRPDLLALLRRTRERGMLTHLNTNGTLLTERSVGDLLEAGVSSMNISLDGATAESHDRTRGVSGSFGKTVEAVRLVDRMRKDRGAALRLKVVSVLSEDNLDEVAEYLALAASLGVDCVEFIPRQPFPEGAGKGAVAGPETLAKLERVLALLSDAEALPVPLEDSARMLALFPPTFRGEPSPLACHAGYNSLAVDCYGRIFPCLPYLNWDRPAGNVSDMPLETFWYSKAYAPVRAEVARCKACTLNCQAELNLLFNPFTKI
jgi:MoaA/NifB/PqqE/SkfB family radical SAM enzyme